MIAAAAVLVLAPGCAPGTQFVYKPAPPQAGGERFPVKVAVIAFKDGTEDFTRRGSVLVPESLTHNAAKSGWMPPELWAKTFADDMAASGAFRSVRFIYDRSELLDEDFHIEGTLEKAYVYGDPHAKPGEFAFVLRAFRRKESAPFWEKEVSR